MAKRNHFKLNLILLGDPGAGKATQAAYIAKKYQMFDFDMGRQLTLARTKNKAIEKAQQQTADRGILTPTAIVRKIDRDIIASISNNKGILFDGHPKMLGEAKLINGLLKKTNRSKPLVLYIQIPVEETIKRITARKGYYKTKFNKRADDTIAGLKNRFKYYRKNIKEVVDYFGNVYTLAHIDGMGSREQVRKRIQKSIEFYIKNYEQINKKA